MAVVKLPCRAYHGTTLERAERILADGAQGNDRDWEWLGWGFYLFQDAPYHAAEWAEFKSSGGKGLPAIIAATVNLDNCFDLIDIDVWEYAREFFNQFGSGLFGAGLVQDPIIIDNGEVTSSGYHYMDCRFMNALVTFLREDKKETLWSVRAAFLEGRAIFPESHLYDKAHVQIAALEPNLILADCSIMAV